MLNRVKFQLYKYTLYTISILSNTYCGATKPTQTVTSPDKREYKCIHARYCLPVITTLCMLLLTTIMLHCSQYYMTVIVANKQKNKRNVPIRYVVSNVYECNIEDINQ